MTGDAPKSATAASFFPNDLVADRGGMTSADPGVSARVPIVLRGPPTPTPGVLPAARAAAAAARAADFFESERDLLALLVTGPRGSEVIASAANFSASDAGVLAAELGFRVSFSVSCTVKSSGAASSTVAVASGFDAASAEGGASRRSLGGDVRVMRFFPLDLVPPAVASRSSPEGAEASIAAAGIAASVSAFACSAGGFFLGRPRPRFAGAG